MPTSGTQRVYCSGVTALLTLLGLAVTGCIEVDQTLTLEPDGSGSLAVSYAVSEQTMRRIEGIHAASERIASDRKLSLERNPWMMLVFDPEALNQRLKQYANKGIYLDRFNASTANAQQNVSFKVSFDSIAEVASADFFASYGFSLIAGERNRMTLITGPWVSNRVTRITDLESPEALTLLRPLIGNFRFALTIRPPGRVLDTNAHRSTPVNAQWNYDASETPGAFFDFQETPIRLVFDGSRSKIPPIRQTRPAD